jgi:hypothetical protein
MVSGFVILTELLMRCISLGTILFAEIDFVFIFASTEGDLIILIFKLPHLQIIKLFRDVAQLVEYRSGGREVASSSLVIPTKMLECPRAGVPAFFVLDSNGKAASSAMIRRLFGFNYFSLTFLL